MERRREMVKLREARVSDAEIGRRQTPPISKQRVGQILKGIRKPPKGNFDSKVMLMPGDVARLLGVHVNTVRRWSKKGILKSYRIITPRGDRRFKREDIDKFLQERQIMLFLS